MAKSVSDPSIVRDLVISVFALNGRMVETGNRLTQDLGLSTASWQVLGALGYSSLPLPVAQIARNMGLSRQSVQRIVDLLAARVFVRFEPNPYHQRAKLVVLTEDGRAALKAAEAAEAPINQSVLREIGGDRIAAAIAVLTAMDRTIAQLAREDGAEIDTNGIP